MTDEDSETQLDDVLDTVHQWHDAFEKSAEFAAAITQRRDFFV